MVLYIGASLYHILCFSIHKLLFHKDDKAMLVVGDNIFSKNGMRELEEDITGARIFDQMEVLNFIEGAYTNPIHLNEESTNEDIKKYVYENEIWVEQWLEKKNINMKEMTHIYSAIDHRHLGAYVLSKKMPYSYFEDGNGLLSRAFVQLEFHMNAQYESYAVSKYLGALGNNPNVIKKYANKMAQLPGFHDEKMVDFQVISLFSKLEKEEQERIFHMFHMEEIIDTKGKKPVLYLTRYVQYMQHPSMNQHHFMATILLDLFAGDRPVLIKSHPRDFTGRYRELFPDALVLAKQFPSELLPFVTTERFQKVITVGSTAIDALTQMSEEVIKLDVPFENILGELYGYIAMVLVVKHAWKDLKTGEFAYQGEAGEFVTPLVKELLGIELKEAHEGERYRLLWVDEKCEEEISADCRCCLYPEYFDEFRMKEINSFDVTTVKETIDSVGNPYNGRIHFQTEDETVRNQLENITLQKEFPYTLSKMTITPKESLQQEYLSECMKIKYSHHFFDLPEIGEQTSQMDVEAMKNLAKMLEETREVLQ